MTETSTSHETLAPVPQPTAPPGVLLPGTHLVELQFARPVPGHVLRDALARMAFEDVLFDASAPSAQLSAHLRRGQKPSGEQLLVPDLWLHWQEWGIAPEIHAPSPHRYRFVGKLKAPLQTVDTAAVRWIFTHTVPIDVHDEAVHPESSALGAELVRGQTYAMRFLTRMLSQPTREAVCEALALVGFRPSKMIMLKRNMRVPGLPSASVARWYGIGRWECPDSVLTGDDPLFFEELHAVES